MEVIYLCLDCKCKANNKFIQDLRMVASNTGEHHHHDCRDLEDLQGKLDQYSSFLLQYNVDQLLNSVDQQCSELKKAFTIMIEGYLNSQKRFILAQTSQSVKNLQLIDAVLKKDLEYIKKEQVLYTTLIHPEHITKEHEVLFLDISHKLTESNDLMMTQLLQMFKLAHQKTNPTGNLERVVLLEHELHDVNETLKLRAVEYEQKNQQQESQAQNLQQQIRDIRSQLEDEQKLHESAQQKLNDAAQQKHNEEAQKKLNDAAQKKLNDEAQKKEKKAQEEAQKKLNDAAQQKLNEEAQKKLNEEAQKKLNDEAQQKLNEEAQKKLNEEAQKELNDEELNDEELNEDF